MKLARTVLDELVVRPGAAPGLGHRSTESTTADWNGSSEQKDKKVADADLRAFVDELAEAPRLLWANDTHALLVVLQAMDAAGKDGTTRHVMSGVNPQGAGSRPSGNPPSGSSPTTSCGARPRSSPSGG